jgi:hypothetical protein
MALVGGTINAVSAAVEVNGLGVQMNGLSVEEPSGLADGISKKTCSTNRMYVFFLPRHHNCIGVVECSLGRRGRG